ncbi:MAG TPA: hypothetical protein PK442_14230, partial [Synergistales bacterium]|nr:hypothetical protein [Synergistales bacterium]
LADAFSAEKTSAPEVRPVAAEFVEDSGTASPGKAPAPEVRPAAAESAPGSGVASPGKGLEGAAGGARTAGGAQPISGAAEAAPVAATSTEIREEPLAPATPPRDRTAAVPETPQKQSGAPADVVKPSETRIVQEKTPADAVFTAKAPADVVSIEKASVDALSAEKAPADVVSAEKAPADVVSAEKVYARRSDSAPFFSELSRGGGDESAALSAPRFSLVMTDNVRPRRMLMYERTPAEIGAEASIRFRSAVAALRNGVQEVRSTNVREPLMSSVPRDFQAAVKAEQILRSAVESELSTNALVQEDQPGHSLFSADRALFAGNEKNAHNIRSEELQLRSAPSGRELPSGDSEKTMVHTPGAAESVAVSSSQGMRSNFQDLFSREVVLQARGGAALEDGLQHVVRFLRAEGRPAASIIIDP